MSKSILAAVGLTIGNILGCSASLPTAVHVAPDDSPAIYGPYCNVYMPAACFEAQGGDVVTISFPADFTIHRVELEDGLKALIYSGFQPQTSEEIDMKVESCVKGAPHCSAIISNKTSIEAVYYPRVRGVTSTHVSIEGVKPSNMERVWRFMSSFRACRRQVQDKLCGTEPMFQVPQVDAESGK